jgi:hypothetical protein
MWRTAQFFVVKLLNNPNSIAALQKHMRKSFSTAKRQWRQG